MECVEKRDFLEYLKNRIARIEKVIGDVDFYEETNNVNEIKLLKTKSYNLKNSSNSSISTSINKEPENENEKEKKIENDKENEKETDIYENSSFFNDVKLSLNSISLENINANREELLEVIKKHRHKNSLSIHICVIKFIIQHIFKDFLCDVYNKYNDFYVYIHSNNAADVYNTLECKKNILVSHIDFMKTYCNKIRQIEKLKSYINSVQISETDVYFERLEKIEKTNEQLFSKIAEINSNLENTAYKYGIMMQLISKIILKYKQFVS